MTYHTSGDALAILAAPEFRLHLIMRSDKRDVQAVRTVTKQDAQVQSGTALEKRWFEFSNP